LTETPAALPIFINAYPNAKSAGSANQFLPSREFRDIFKTAAILGGDVEPWPFLRMMYAVQSMMAAHSEMGAFSGHKRVKGGVHALFIEPDWKRT